MRRGQERRQIGRVAGHHDQNEESPPQINDPPGWGCHLLNHNPRANVLRQPQRACRPRFSSGRGVVGKPPSLTGPRGRTPAYRSLNSHPPHSRTHPSQPVSHSPLHSAHTTVATVIQQYAKGQSESGSMPIDASTVGHA
eukprot:1057808-Prymnesium_polylepis.3